MKDGGLRCSRVVESDFKFIRDVQGSLGVNKFTQDIDMRRKNFESSVEVERFSPNLFDGLP